ncbi:hypothetical protein PCANC_28687 [Puccinia coronata f. sp. avenae]|uniref:Uncharacterized protein n=1 Tax=Puccinia coronata f. sp. avenae TaxID=200324 RepID=A0A2N5TBJ9_9BASI|nr:hypothetical protein PCANC_28687 [Puccinia coronata f. sp. avenae]
MNVPSTDPTLDFLEEQFPPSQSMLEIEDLFKVNPTVPPDQSLAPSLVESRENSRPLESNHSTPVPVPIEREIQPNSSSLLPRDPANLPRVNIPRADVNSEEVKAAVGILDSQWNLFLKARSANNVQLMRAALMQAYHNQLVLLQLVGNKETMRLSHNWNAKDELDKLEARMLSPLQNSHMAIDNDPVNPNQSNELHQSSPHPTTTHQQANLPPSALGTDNHYPSAFQRENSHYIPPHHLGYPYNPYHTNPQQVGYQGQTEYSPPAGYQPPIENASQQQSRQPNSHTRQGNNQNRGRGRNRQRNRDSTSNMMEIGNFFVRAERALNAIQRRGRGRRPRRQGRGNNQAPANNAAPQ